MCSSPVAQRARCLDDIPKHWRMAMSPHIDALRMSLPDGTDNLNHLDGDHRFGVASSCPAALCVCDFCHKPGYETAVQVPINEKCM
jgi:hypothetical protein